MLSMFLEFLLILNVLQLSQSITIVNKNLGADNTSQTLIDFNWYNPHLYQVPQEFKKFI